jgi:hypothetical protein
MGPLRENQFTFLSISRSVLRIMRNISDKSFRVCSISIFENRVVYEIVWKIL